MIMSNRKAIIITLLLVVIIIFLYRVRIVLTPFLFAALIAYAAYPLVMVFENREVPRSIAIILVYLIFSVILGVLFSFLIPQLIAEIDDILKVLPEQTEKLEDGLDIFKELQNISVPEVLRNSINLLINRIQRLLEGFAERIAGLLVTMVSQIIGLVIAPFLAYYLLRDIEAIKRRTIMYIPIPYRTKVNYLARQMNDVLNGFIRGQLVNSAIVGLLIAAGLAIVGIRYALFIGLIAGLLNIIPYFGPVIGFLPAFVLAIVKSPMTVFWVLVIFIVVNQLEASIISPRIIGQSVGLHPLAVIFAVLAGGELMGLIGMLIAVPIGGIVRILITYYAQLINDQA